MRLVLFALLASASALVPSASGFALHNTVPRTPLRRVGCARVVLDDEAQRVAIIADVQQPVAPVRGVVVPTISTAEYQCGLVTVALITLLFASNSPALRSAFISIDHVPPVLLVSAIASCTALSSLVAGGPLLNSVTAAPPTLEVDATDAVDPVSIRAGVELGLLKYLGTSANLLGLSLTTANHGAFLIQLTTLIVPVAQGLAGVPIPPRIWTAVGVALCGLLAFTADPASGGLASLDGDLLCVLAACFYAAYDLRLFVWGKRVTALRLITNKVAAQALLSVSALALLGAGPALQFAADVSSTELAVVAPFVLWSGVVVNGVAPFLQVGGQQAIGPARAQVIYASGPLWAALLSLVALGETVGPQGLVGGAAFLAAVLLAATAPAPDADCDEDVCEA
jgi:drug/metabolite transporter (DMT)-like permease